MKKIVELNRKGFTLIEVIVVAAIIAILAGILVPMIFNQIDESKKARALGEAKTLLETARNIRHNTHLWPTWSYDSGACAEDVVYLLNTNSTKPTLLTPLTGNGIAMADVLNAAKGSALAGCYKKVDDANAWAGPYLAGESGVDPWGRSYIIYLDKLKSANAAPATRWGWVISAGPDGIIQTDVTDPAITAIAAGNDDIGIRITD